MRVEHFHLNADRRVQDISNYVYMYTIAFFVCLIIKILSSRLANGVGSDKVESFGTFSSPNIV